MAETTVTETATKKHRRVVLRKRIEIEAHESVDLPEFDFQAMFAAIAKRHGMVLTVGPKPTRDGHAPDTITTRVRIAPVGSVANGGGFRISSKALADAEQDPARLAKAKAAGYATVAEFVKAKLAEALS